LQVICIYDNMLFMLKNNAIEGFRDILKGKGFKDTPNRRAILEIFLNNEKPISVDFIYKKFYILLIIHK